MARLFFDRVAVGASDECWLWLGTISKTTGYGRYSANVDAHRVAYEVAHGPIPKGMHVLHSCDNRPCCNPGHLRAGTRLDNMADMRNRRRSLTSVRNSQNKLTVAEADLVRQLRGVMTCTEVGLLFKISRSQVSRIQTGKKRGSELLP